MFCKCCHLIQVQWQILFQAWCCLINIFHPFSCSSLSMQEFNVVKGCVVNTQCTHSYTFLLAGLVVEPITLLVNLTFGWVYLQLWWDIMHPFLELILTKLPSQLFNHLVFQFIFLILHLFYKRKKKNNLKNRPPLLVIFTIVITVIVSAL